MQTHLYERKQFIKYHGCTFTYFGFPATAGAPQGTVHALLLFWTNIDDITDDFYYDENLLSLVDLTHLVDLAF